MPMCPNCGSYVSPGSPTCSCGTSFGSSSEPDNETLEAAEIELIDRRKRSLMGEAKSYAKKKEYLKEIECYDRILEDCMDDNVLHKKGIAYFNLKDYETALNCFERLIKRGQKSRDYIWKGDVLFEMDRIHESIESYHEGIREIYDNEHRHKKNDELSNLYRALGWKYNQIGEYELAIQMFEEAIFFNSNNSNNWNCKAIALENANELKEALKFYDIALELNPSSETILKNKQDCLNKLKSHFKSKIDVPDSDDSIPGYSILELDEDDIDY